MCGIAGLHVKDRYVDRLDLEYIVDELALGIMERGQDATGVCAVNTDGAVLLNKAPVSAMEWVVDRPLLPEATKTVLLHTRLATQGDPKHNENNHPVVYGTCFAVHNGVLSNDEYLMGKHDFNKLAEVDSLVIPALLSEANLDDTEEIRKTLEEIRGSMAIAAVDPIRHPGKLVLAKGSGSPLIILNHKYFIVWASTRWAITDMWKRVIGTPPADSRFYSADEGELFIVEGDRISSSTFKPPYKFYGYSSSSTSYATTYQDLMDCDMCGDSYSPWLMNFAQMWGTSWDVCNGCLNSVEQSDDSITSVKYSKIRYGSGSGSCGADDLESFECESCAVVTTYRNKIKMYDGRELCDDCRPKSESPVSEWEHIAEFEEHLHRRALLEVAWELNTTSTFIDWILFRCSLEELEDPTLAETRERVELEYENARKVVEYVDVHHGSGD